MAVQLQIVDCSAILNVYSVTLISPEQNYKLTNQLPMGIENHYLGILRDKTIDDKFEIYPKLWKWELFLLWTKIIGRKV